MSSLKDKINKLPPDLQKEVQDFVDFLLLKSRRQRKSTCLSQDWAGGLKDYRSQYSSLDLEKKALEWREGKK